MEQIKVTTDTDNVLISIPKELLIFAANDNPEFPMRVTDKNKFIQKIVHGIENYADSNDIEIGLTHFTKCLDRIIVSLYESGHDCIKESKLPISLTKNGNLQNTEYDNYIKQKI